MPTRPTHALLAIIIATIFLPACSSLYSDTGSQNQRRNQRPTALADLPPDPAPKQAADAVQGRRLTTATLRERMRSFSDQYRSVLANAADTIKRNRDDPLVRSRAHQLKIDGPTAMYAIVMDTSPQTAMLNGLVLISLQQRLAEATAHADFPDDHPLVREKINDLHDEAWTLAALVMKERERQELVAVIDRWWDANKSRTDIWYVRLTDLAGYGSGTSLEGMFNEARGLPASVLNAFVPVNDASDSLSSVANTAEIANWYAPRLLILAQWRAEAIVFETLATTEIREILTTVDDATAIANRALETADTLPRKIGKEIETTATTLQQNEETLRNLLTDTETVIGSVNQTTTNATQLVDAVDRTVKSIETLAQTTTPLVEKFTANNGKQEPAQPAKPFDINEYTGTVRAVEASLQEATNLATTIDTMTQAERIGTISASLTSVIWHAAAAIIACLAAAAVATIAILRFRNAESTSTNGSRKRLSSPQA